MVYVLNLDEDTDSTITSSVRYPLNVHHGSPEARPDNPAGSEKTSQLFSAVLACYPVAVQIACHLDLNTLHDLSATCRQFRVNLIQYRKHLVREALRCVNDHVLETHLNGIHVPSRTNGNVTTLGTGARLTRGKIGVCARDLVGECRRCGIVVCRNCAIKPPPAKAVSGRLRRLCRKCMESSIHQHVQSTFWRTAEESSSNFTYDAFSRSPCCCPDMVFICLSCGNALRSADTLYARAWMWRTRYSTYLGGLGTGIGEGNEGVECGRGPNCLDALDVEKEIDCDARELVSMTRDIELIEIEGRQWDGTGYLTQEIEGIGGVVKQKVKKRVKVGAVVKEYEDERVEARYLAREQKGINRGWCCWCDRVVLSQEERQHVCCTAEDALRQAGSSCSSSSTGLEVQPDPT